MAVERPPISVPALMLVLSTCDVLPVSGQLRTRDWPLAGVVSDLTGRTHSGADDRVHHVDVAHCSRLAGG